MGDFAMNIVMIVLDTQRGDHLGCAGYWRKDISPNIDRIASEGVLFKDFYAGGIPTGAGFTTMFTGLYPIHHRFYLTPWEGPNYINFDDSVPMAAEIFRDHGFVTAAADNLINFESHMKQFVRGYRYYLNPTPANTPHAWVTADQFNAMALPWIENIAKPSQPFFAFIHYWDPHLPYNHPEEWRDYYHYDENSASELPKIPTKAGYDYVPGWGPAHKIDEYSAYAERYIRRGWTVTREYYDEEVRYVDNAVGQVYRALEAQGILDDTCILITGDHGEELGQHGKTWDHRYMFDSTTHVPLIIRCPKSLPQGKIVSGIAQHVDIVPTLMDIAGVKDDKLKFDGYSLLPQIRGEAPGRPYAFTEGGINWLYDRAILKDGCKLIWHGYTDRVESYNVDADPAEIYDLADSEPDKRNEMVAFLEKIVAEMLDGDEDPMPRAGCKYTYPLQNFMQVALGQGRKKR
jgi:arylsulfatase